MSKKQKRKRKHIPQRTCVGCRSVQPKRSLIRLVRTTNGIEIDVSGKMPGRGAYLHELRSCWEKGLKGSLVQALKTEITTDIRNTLITFMNSLPENLESSDENNQKTSALSANENHN